QQQARFGFLLDAFRYGAPPHAGFAVGIDRLTAILAGEDNIREVIAYPKTQSGADPLTDAPTPIDESQLRELGRAIRPAPRRARARPTARTRPAPRRRWTDAGCGATAWCTSCASTTASCGPTSGASPSPTVISSADATATGSSMRASSRRATTSCA